MCDEDKTPFEAAGYTNHTVFKYIGNEGHWPIGTLVRLRYDDNTLNPSFQNVDDERSYHYAYLHGKADEDGESDEEYDNEEDDK